ncbi:FAD binding domain-containing protein [Xylaria sp. FL0043]|nr:FAD binding domain-containing protein [Xylaria sp. FL0043]
MKMHTTPHIHACHVVIIGGGLAGLASAISLHRAGHRATVLERTGEFVNIGGLIHLPPNACRALRSLGVLDGIMRLPGIAFEPQHISLLAYDTGDMLKRMDLIPNMRQTYGLPYLTVQRASLHQCLLKYTVDLGATVEFNTLIDSIDFDLPSIRLAGNRLINADLIIGADGENSTCRSMLLGRPDPPLHFGHQIFSCDIPLSAIDDNHPDLQCFVSDPGTSWWLGPGTMAIATIMKGQHEYLNLMGGLIDPEPTEVRGRPKDLSKQVVKDSFVNWSPVINKLVGLSISCNTWTSTVTPVLRKWCHPSGRFSLLGDAAHAMTPYLAQGAAQCFEDAVALGTIMSRVSSGEQIPEALGLYHMMREPRCQRLKDVSIKLRDVYCAHEGPAQRRRDHDLQHCEPKQGFVIPWLDPEFQAWMYAYDVEREAIVACAGRELGNAIGRPFDEEIL